MPRIIDPPELGEIIYVSMPDGRTVAAICTEPNDMSPHVTVFPPRARPVYVVAAWSGSCWIVGGYE